jgi:hypothetical protein
MQFNGGYVAVADSSWFDFERYATIEFWVRPTTTQRSRMLYKGDGVQGGSDQSFGVGTTEATPSFGAAYFLTDGRYRFTDGSVAPVGEWTHVAATVDALEGITVYLNGVVDQQVSYGAVGVSLRNGTQPLTIGGDPNWPGWMFAGLIDEIRIWNIARTPAQIAASYTTGVEPTSPGLVAYYTFDEGSGSSVQDRTGHGLTGAINGDTAWVPIVPPCTAPEVTHGPLSQSVCAPSSASFTISTSGTAPSFQWRKDGSDIDGATAPSYTISSVVPEDAGTYDCVVTNACGAATSTPATLTVRTPQILTQPVSQTVNVDQPVFFALEADPLHPCHAGLAYRWQRRNPLVEDDAAPNAWLELSDGGGLSGTHTPNLAIFRPTPGLATGYRCKISNACGCEADANGVMYTNTVNFAAACPSDFNNDGSVDGDDVIEFFERWDSGC